MKIFSPEYYKNFVCIADKCRHSCCIGWEIDVDRSTAKKYASLNEGYGLEIQKSITKRGVPHFKLKKDDRCPHLNEKGLCKIILNLGEGYLCHICREHPRFYNYTSLGKEVGLGLSCEEACRIILSSDNYESFVEIGEIFEDEETVEAPEFDATVHRKTIFYILKDRSIPYSQKLQKISEAYGVSPVVIPDETWISTLDSLEYLNNSHKAIFACYSSEINDCKELENYLERALAYFIFRHCSNTEDAGEFRAALGFSLFCEKLLASLCRNTKNFEEICDMARIISEELEYSEDNTEAIKTEFYFC